MRFIELGRQVSDNGVDVIVDLNYCDKGIKPHAIDLQIGGIFATLNENKIKELIWWLEQAVNKINE
jgi:hypothetical protein